MKSFKQFREECGCDKKEKKVKSKKKGNVEVMPTVPDGERGMTTKPTNEAWTRKHPTSNQQGSNKEPIKPLQIRSSSIVNT